MKVHVCHACGYDVRGQSLGTPCPECGRPVRPPARMRRRRERAATLGLAAGVLMAGQGTVFATAGMQLWIVVGFLLAWITVKVNALRFLLEDAGPPAWPTLVVTGALVFAGLGLFFSMCGVLWLTL